MGSKNYFTSLIRKESESGFSLLKNAHTQLSGNSGLFRKKFGFPRFLIASSIGRSKALATM
jgi:hypothetical protein